MFPYARPSEMVAVLGVIAPISQGAGTANSGWISAASCERFLALLQTGVLGASATLDAKVQQATDSSGTGAKDVTGKAITQILKASGDGKQVELQFRADELDTNGGFDYFQVSMTVGTAASEIAAVILGFFAKSVPASALNATTVVQIV